MIRVLHRDMETGAFMPVAWVDGFDLEFAYKATQNGVLTESWSMRPVTGVRPIGTPFHLIDGRKLGRRSSMVGDLFERRGRTHLVASIGFVEMAPVPTGMTEADLGPEPTEESEEAERALAIWTCKVLALRFCGLKGGADMMGFQLAMDALVSFAGKADAQQFAARAFPIGHAARAPADLALGIETLSIGTN